MKIWMKEVKALEWKLIVSRNKEKNVLITNTKIDVFFLRF